MTRPARRLQKFERSYTETHVAPRSYEQALSRVLNRVVRAR